MDLTVQVLSDFLGCKPDSLRFREVECLVICEARVLKVNKRHARSPRINASALRVFPCRSCYGNREQQDSHKRLDAHGHDAQRRGKGRRVTTPNENTGADPASALTNGLCGCGRAVRYETTSGPACNKHMRCLTYEEQGQALAAANMRWMILHATMSLVREYPDFDHGGLLAEAMDDAMAGKVPIAIANIERLFERLPHNAKLTGASGAVAAKRPVE